MKPGNYESIATRWFENDLIATSEWVGGLPSGGGRDAATRVMVDALVKAEDADFDAAFAWARSIDDASRREAAYKKVFPKWLAHDADIADAALEGLNLSDDTENTIRDPFGAQRGVFPLNIFPLNIY